MSADKRCFLPVGRVYFAVFALALGLAAASATPFEDNKDTKNDVKPALQSGPEPRVNIEPRLKKSNEPDPAETDRRSNIRIDTTVVLIPVTVTDPINRFVTGLEKEHFKVFEDKVEQQIAYFASEDAPLSIGLVFDTSGSMGNKLAKSRQAVSEFFKTANPEDEFFMVQFNDRPEIVQDFTTNLEEIQNRLLFTQPKGR